jgi:hypothetical protein
MKLSELFSTGIYSIKNTVNQKEYIGQSIDIFSRVRKHYKLLIANKHANLALQEDFNKYGKDCFVVEIIELIKVEKELLNITLLERESLIIDSKNKKYLYNITVNYPKKLSSSHEKVNPVSPSPRALITTKQRMIVTQQKEIRKLQKIINKSNDPLHSFPLMMKENIPDIVKKDDYQRLELVYKKLRLKYWGLKSIDNLSPCPWVKKHFYRAVNIR